MMLYFCLSHSYALLWIMRHFRNQRLANKTRIFPPCSTKNRSYIAKLSMFCFSCFKFSYIHLYWPLYITKRLVWQLLKIINIIPNNFTWYLHLTANYLITPPHKTDTFCMWSVNMFITSYTADFCYLTPWPSTWNTHRNGHGQHIYAAVIFFLNCFTS